MLTPLPGNPRAPRASFKKLDLTVFHNDFGTFVRKDVVHFPETQIYAPEDPKASRRDPKGRPKGAKGNPKGDKGTLKESRRSPKHPQGGKGSSSGRAVGKGGSEKHLLPPLPGNPGAPRAPLASSKKLDLAVFYYDFCTSARKDVVHFEEKPIYAPEDPKASRRDPKGRPKGAKGNPNGDKGILKELQETARWSQRYSKGHPRKA